MARAGYAEKVDRPEPEAIAGPSIERKLDLLIAVSPCAVVTHLLEASEVGRARTKKHVRLSALDCSLRGDDIGRPFDPVPPGRCYKVRCVISPVGFAISIPSVFAEDIVLKHDERRGRSGRERGEAIGVRFPATPAIGVGPRLQFAGFGVRLNRLSVRADDANHRFGAISPKLITDFQNRKRHLVFFEMGIVLGIDQNPLAELIDPDLIDSVVSAIVFKSWPTAQPAGDVTETVKHGVLHNAEMCAMELASNECRIENGERITSGLRGIVVFDSDIRLDPVAQQEDALPLIALSGHDISKPVP